jgi:type IV fimbrial biogenesis protein FimT
MRKKLSKMILINKTGHASTNLLLCPENQKGLLVKKTSYDKPLTSAASPGHASRLSAITGRRIVSGLSLIELLTVITIVAILMAIGVPSYQSVITSNNISSEVNALASDLAHARSEAIKNGAPVSVCASDTSGAAPYTCSASTTWTGGWITLASIPVNTVLRVQKPLTTTDTAISASANALTTVSFNTFGFSIIKGSITVSPQSGTISPKTVCVSAVGNMAVVAGGDSSCP